LELAGIDMSSKPHALEDQISGAARRLIEHAVSITLDVYSHLMPDMQEKAARALEEALG
jgi:hypothetical protein